MSDIRGTGHGDKHTWDMIQTLQRKIEEDRMTLYQCRVCHKDFWHRYHIIPNIFEAMKDWGVPEECINVGD